MLQANREPDTDATLDQNTPARPVSIDRIPAVVHPSKSSKWLNRFILLALLIIAIGLGVIFRWSFEDTNVLVVKNSPFPVRTIRAHLQDNGVVILNADYCKNLDITGKLRMSFVSTSREVFLPLADERGPKGCNKVDIPVIIPKDLIPDTYKVKFHVIYDINPLKQNIASDFESKEFTVYPTDVSDQ